jgi:tetratricopeptide (TPR) repeat protein
MKLLSLFCAFATLLVALASPAATSQTATGQIKGTVTDTGSPLAGVEIRLANVNAGRSFKIKTDDLGAFGVETAPFGDYEVEIISAGGDKLLTEQITIYASGSPAIAIVKIDVSESKISSLPSDQTPIPGQPVPGSKTKYTKQEIKDIKAKNERTSEMNVLILQANAALLNENWRDAVAPLQQLTGMDPDNWEYFSGLGDAQYHLGQYQEAIGSYEIALLLAGDPGTVNPSDGWMDATKKKTRIGHLLNNEGNVYSELHKTKEALAAYNKSAAIDPEPKLAYFNLCVTRYNLKKVEGAVTACDKAIAVDPGKAEIYYFKGSLLLYENQPETKEKVNVPAGAADALKKYLELAPEGEHATEVRQMLEYLAVLAKHADSGNHTNKN